MEAMTLDKFEEAYEVVKEVCFGDEACVQRLFQCTDREQSLPETGEYAADGCV